MSDLTTGGPDIPWSYPSPAPDGTSNGMVFMGLDHVTEEDFRALENYMDATDFSRDSVDEASLVGRYHPEWTSNFYTKAPGGDKPGGLGSHTYETQHVGSGVQFAKTPIWHYTIAGMYVKEVPAGAGEYHPLDVGDGYTDNHAGPASGSDAAIYLGDSVYYWDTADCWYEVEGKENVVSPTSDVNEASSFCPNCGHGLGK